MCILVNDCNEGARKMERMEDICVLQTQIEFQTTVRKQFDCLLLRIKTERIKKVFVCMFLWYLLLLYYTRWCEGFSSKETV